MPFQIRSRRRRFRRILWVGAAFALAGGCAAPPPSPAERLAAAQAELAAGRTADGLAALEALRAEAPGQAPVLETLANAYAEAGRPAEAARTFVALAELPGADASHRLFAAQAWMEARDYAAAAAQLRAYLGVHPQDDSAWRALGDALDVQGQVAAAAEALRQADALHPRPDTALRLARLAEQLGDPAAAARAYREAYQRDGNARSGTQAEALLGLLGLALEAEDWPAAEGHEALLQSEFPGVLEASIFAAVPAQLRQRAETARAAAAERTRQQELARAQAAAAAAERARQEEAARAQAALAELTVPVGQLAAGWAPEADPPASAGGTAVEPPPVDEEPVLLSTLQIVAAPPADGAPGLTLLPEAPAGPPLSVARLAPDAPARPPTPAEAVAEIARLRAAAQPEAALRVAQDALAWDRSSAELWTATALLQLGLGRGRDAELSAQVALARDGAHEPAILAYREAAPRLAAYHLREAARLAGEGGTLRAQAEAALRALGAN